jgi:heavy metal sensor kinase
MCSKRKSDIFRTVTFRLTLQYALLFSVISLTVFILIYVMMTSSLRQRVDDDLLDSAKEFEELYNTQGIEALRAEYGREAESRGLNRVFFRLLSPDLDALATSDLGSWPGLGLPPEVSARLSRDEVAFSTISVPGHSHKVRAIFKKTEDGNIIHVGFSLEDNERLMERYREIFGTAIVVMLICGGLAGWLMARRAMSGVERVTNMAIRMGKGDLSLRVPLGNEGQEIDNLAKAFNEMAERIQALLTELREVTNNIAHDLRSPLTRIRGIAEATSIGVHSADEYQEVVRMVVEESDRLVEMINTMLAIAEAEAGLAESTKTSIDILEIIESAHGLFLPVAEDKGLHLAVEAPPELLLTIGDVASLQRVIANLLDNAIKYTPAGGKVLISVEGTRTQVVISVTDSGMGIDEQALPLIFNRFYRGDQSRSTPGNGLGLSLVRALVRAHGGEITAESSPGRGSTFTVFLPRTTSPR